MKQLSLKEKILGFKFKTWLEKELLFLFFLVISVFIVYANSLNNDFVSDDIAGILQSPNINNLSQAFSSPLSSIQSFRPILYYITNLLFGLSPWAFRITNILFHVGTAIILYLILFLVTTPRIAKISASIFSVHPLLVESIAWISGGSYPQYSFFILTSLLFFILSVKKNSYLYISLFFLFLSLSTSEKAMIFPLIIIAFILSYGLKPKNLIHLISVLIPGIVIAFAYASLISVRLKLLFFQSNQFINPFLQIPIAITSYLQLIFWPIPLTLYHSEMNFTQTEFVIRFIIFIIFIIVIAISFFKNKPVFFWLSLFLISLFPTLTPFGISWIVAERYIYLGSIGIIVVSAILMEKISALFKQPAISVFLLSLIFIVFSFRTVIRNNDWQNQDTLWLATAKVSPSSPQNHNNLGDLYGRRGQLDLAIVHFQKAIELQPNYSDAYHNLANTYAQTKKLNLAIENYQKALTFNPYLWQSHLNLSAIYFNQQNYDQAAAHLEQAIAINPQNSLLHTNLGIIYLQLNKTTEAKIQFQQSLFLNPNDQQAKFSLLKIEKKQ